MDIQANKSGYLGSHDRLIFMHFPKTGGTTVHNRISKIFKSNEICPERFDTISLWPKFLLDQYRFFSAHAFLSSFRLIADNSKVITFLRDPLERNISAFEYWSSYTDEHIAKYNLHAPRLSRGLGINGLFSRENRAQCASLYSVYANWLLGIRFSPFGIHEHERPADVAERAIEVLETLAFVGISEDLDSSFERLSYTLDIPNTYDGQRDNVTRENLIHLPGTHETRAFEAIKADTLSALAEATAADQIIYDYAAKRFFADQPRQRQLKGMVGWPEIATARRGRDSTWVESHGAGFILFGPYIRLRPRRYKVEFRLAPADSGATSTEPLGFLDVVGDRGEKLLGRTDIQIIDRLGETLIEIEFETSTVYNDIEFRCFSFGVESFKINETTLLCDR